MPEQVAQADANATSVQDAGISSVLNDISEPRSANADAINIVDDEPGKVAGAKTDADGKTVAADKGKVDGVKDGQDGKPVLGADGKPILKDGAADDDRFDKHPRFQELIKGRKEDSETIKNLSQQLDTVMKIIGGKAPQDGKPPVVEDDKPIIPYKDISGMSDEELHEWQEDDIKGYEANRLAQFVHEARMILKGEARENAQRSEQETLQESIKKTYQEYEKDNPEFRKMWDSGEIGKHMKDVLQKTGRRIDAITSHELLTREKVLTAERAKTAKETEDRVIKNFQAKRNAQVLDGGGGRTPSPNENPELVDTKQHGGLMSVLASRLKGMRTASG